MIRPPNGTVPTNAGQTDPTSESHPVKPLIVQRCKAPKLQDTPTASPRATPLLVDNRLRGARMVVSVRPQDGSGHPDRELPLDRDSGEKWGLRRLCASMHMVWISVWRRPRRALTRNGDRGGRRSDRNDRRHLDI